MVQQMAIHDKTCRLIVSVSILCPKQLNNLSWQDAGWNVLHFLQLVTDTKFQQLRQSPSIISTVHRQLNIAMETVKVA